MAGAFAASKGGYGYRRIRPAFRTRVSEKVLRGIMAEDGLTAHVPERRGYGSYEGGKTLPALGNLADRDFTAGMPNGKRPADITPGSRPGTGRACLSPPVD
nr:IS3 family transposase [Bifidobacterium catenulatum]